MQVKLGCMTRPWMNYPLERALEGIAQAGFTYTAYVGNNENKPSYTLESTAKELADLREKVESFGLRSVAAWAGDPLRYGSEGLRRHIDYGQQLGLEYLILSSPYVKQRQNPQLSFDDEFVNYVEEALPLAEATGIRLHVKPHSGEFGAGPGLAYLVERVGHPLFRVSYDPGNIHSYEGLQAHEDIASVAQHVESLCVKDFKSGQQVKRYVSPGDGDVHWAPVWRSLADVNFSGYALIELLGGQEANELDNEAMKSRQRLLDWVAQAEGSVAS